MKMKTKKENGTTEYKDLKIENTIDFETFWKILLMAREVKWGEAHRLYETFNRLTIESKLGLNLF